MNKFVSMSAFKATVCSLLLFSMFCGVVFADKEATSLSDLVVEGAQWAGRINWDATAAGRDERDWHFSFHVTSVDGKHFKGTVDMGPDGRGTARDAAVTGDFTDETIQFKSSKLGNFQISMQGKLTEPRTIEFTWTGSDRKNEPRTGTAKIKLKKPGKGDK